MQIPLLSVSNIHKSFFGQKVLQDISFDILEGEVVGLLGANGAGKSTLLKIIGGTQTTDSGSISLCGKTIEHNSPYLALALGIVSVYQELNLFANLTVAENLFLGREIKNQAGLIDWQETNRKTQRILDEYGLSIPADMLVANLSVAKQHLVEIARAFNENPKLLLLDEPTSTLSETEIEWLFAKIKAASKKGTTVIYVSHRLDEVTEICQRNVILRDGKLVHISDGPMEKSNIIQYVVGHNVVFEKTLTEKKTSEITLECRNIRSENGVCASELHVRKGEILGIAGLVGSGRTEILNTLFGIDPLDSGIICKDGEEITIKSPSDAIHHRIMLIPEDRKIGGLFLSESARFNIASATLGDRSKMGLVDTAAEKTAVTESAEQVILDTRRLNHFVRQLSGGNQQKVVIAKTLLANADILLLDEPTRGVDIGAREEIYAIIKELAHSGKSILLVTSDWEELIYLSDRVVVMSEMQVVGEIEGEITESEILHKANMTAVKKETRREKKSTWLSTTYNRLFAARTNNFLLLLFILAGFLILGSVLSSHFRTWLNFSNLFGQAMPLIILSLGQLVVIIAGGIDISSGALMAAAGVIGLSLMAKMGLSPEVGVLTMLAFGGLVGLANAVLIQKAKVDPFVVTIGMMLVMEGTALIVSPKPFGPAPEIFKTLFSGNFFGVPSAMILLALLLLVFAFLLRFTTLGRGFYAVGENKNNAFNAGFRVNRIVILSYIFCSLMSVLAAIYILGRFGAADPVLGPGMELQAIACVLIGGATLAGGRGSIAGTICGVFVLTILANILSLIDVSVWYQEVITGAMLLFIIASYERMIRSKKAFAQGS
jgi:ABC-type sugar transport system ATPase subunit/ribose/xylose/arabinose/galactoside ABC-type transport system permease subunit